MTSPHESDADGEPPFVAPPIDPQARIWLVRHGETEWSAQGKHTGKTDLPLTDAGRRQADALSSFLGEISPSLVISSPRQRALDTARLAGLRVDDTDEDLAEWDYGDYEGRTSDDIRTEAPGWTVFADGAPNGESAQQVAARADRVLARAAESSASGPVVLFGHGHMSRVLGARWIGLPVRAGANLLLGTAAACILGAEHHSPVIVRWNITNPAADGGRHEEQ